MTAKKTAGVALALLLGCGLLSAQSTDDKVVLLSPRNAALGGAHAALADDLATLFSNPAGLQSVDPVLRVTEATVNLSGPVFDITGLVVEGIGGTDLATLLTEPDVQAVLNGLAAGASLSGPVSFGYVGGGLGVGIFSWTETTFQSVGTLTLEAMLRETFLINGGYSFRIPLPASWKSHIDAGLLLKAFLQSEVRTVKSVVDLVSLMSDPAVLLLGQPFTVTAGVGMDAGIRFAVGQWFALGIAARDLYSPMSVNEYTSLQDFLGSGAPVQSQSAIPMDLSAGMLFSPGLGRLGRHVTDFRLAVDYRDILDFVLRPAEARNWILHLGVGLEATLLKILSVRIGFTEGLFAAGIGLDLSFMKLDAAMYGAELSSEPGLRPVYNVAIGLRSDLSPREREPRVPRQPRDRRERPAAAAETENETEEDSTAEEPAGESEETSE